jgi:hypothetical protein
VVLRGKMTLFIDGEPTIVTGGHIIWFEQNREYEILQDPDNPLATNFLRMKFVDADGNPVILDDIPAGVIQSVDINLAEAICRRITELMWEAYHDARESGIDLESEKHIPRPYFTNESELTRSSPFCPLLINIHAPQDQESHSAMRAAKALFQGLISEIQYQLARQKRVIVSGLEQHHRQLIASIALQLQQDPKNAPSVSDIASRAGYSTDHFTLDFPEDHGLQPATVPPQRPVGQGQGHVAGVGIDHQGNRRPVGLLQRLLLFPPVQDDDRSIAIRIPEVRFLTRGGLGTGGLTGPGLIRLSRTSTGD